MTLMSAARLAAFLLAATQLGLAAAPAMADELPILHGGELRGIKSINRQTFGLINQRLALLRSDGGTEDGEAGALTDELEAWWQFYALSGDQNRREALAGYELTTYGLAVGVDKALFDYGVIGMGFSWGETTVNSKGPGDADTEVDSYMLNLYGDYDFGRLYLNGVLSFGYNDLATAKTAAGGERTASYHANYYSARAEMGYALMQGKTRLIPKILGHYSYYTPGSYTEEGFASQTITKDSIRSFELGLGLDMNWLLRSDETSYWVPEVRVGYRYDLINEVVAVTSQPVNGGPATLLQGPDPAAQSWDLGAGITYFKEDAWELLFNYDLTFDEDYLSHAGTVRAAYKFY